MRVRSLNLKNPSRCDTFLNSSSPTLSLSQNLGLALAFPIVIFFLIFHTHLFAKTAILVVAEYVLSFVTIFLSPFHLFNIIMKSALLIFFYPMALQDFSVFIALLVILLRKQRNLLMPLPTIAPVLIL